MNRATLIAYHSMGAFLLVPLYLNGWLADIWAEPTKISTGIMIALGLGAVLSVLGEWREVGLIADTSVFAGLIGTVIGIIIAFSNLDPSQMANVEYARSMGTALLSGMSVALYTTLVGAVSFVWLNIAQHFWGPKP